MKFNVNCRAINIEIEQCEEGNYTDFSSVREFLQERVKKYNVGAIIIIDGEQQITVEDGKNKILSGASYESLLNNTSEDTEDYRSLLITTSHILEGYKVVKTIDVVSSECVYGMHLFKDLFTAITDVFGGRSKTVQKVLRDARQTCLNELRREADLLGANAVIAVDLDYSELSGGHGTMLMLVATGTAVQVEKIEVETLDSINEKTEESGLTGLSQSN